MNQLIEIIKFKITVFMGIIASVGFLVINFEKITTTLGLKTAIWLIIIIMLIYSLVGFIKNMIKLTKLEKEINDQWS
jgi:UDP-N-acetylmuramyl pentapeptide phosphotransferase/UDP-N-acetylglucosamine-1-phosphate transferase